MKSTKNITNLIVYAFYFQYEYYIEELIRLRNCNICLQNFPR